MSEKNRKGLIVLLAMFSIFGILTIVNNKRKAAEFLELKEFGKLTNGKIEQVVIRVTSGGDFSLFYKFTANGKRYEGSKSVDCVLPDFSLAPVFENKRFPVVYSEKNPKVNMMLIGRPEFEEFGVAFPDTLAKISRKYFECNK